MTPELVAPPRPVGGAVATTWFRLLDRTRGASRVALIALLLVVVVVVGAVSTATAPSGLAVALWWPAAAVCVVVLLLTRRYRPLVIGLLVAAVALSLFIGGRPVFVSVGYAPFGVTEAWIVATVLSRRGRTMRITSGRDVLVLVMVTLGGSIVAGVGIAVVATLSGVGAPLPTVVAVIASHWSALLVILPVLMTPITRIGDRAGEMLVQAVLLVICIVVVFRPGQSEPMTFLIFPFIAWAAFRFDTYVIAVQIFLTATACLLLSAFGGGPFASTDGGEILLKVELLQFFLISISSPALFLGLIRSQQRVRDALVAERERFLTDGLVRAQVGFLLFERRPDGSINVIEQNEVAKRLLPLHGSEQTDESGVRVLRTVLSELDETEDDWGGEIESHDGKHHLEVHATSFWEGDRRLVTVDISDVTSHRRAEEAASFALASERAAADELRLLYRLQEEFVASISHELRTPLTSIIGFAEGLRDDVEVATRVEVEVEVILRNARRLASLVEDLLAERAGDTAVMGSESVAIDDVVRDCVEDQRIHAEALGVDVWVDLGAGSARVDGSLDAVSRIVTNLLSNAIKFATRPGRVEISSRVDGDRVEVVIRDDGPGIPDHDRDRVFERFYRSTDPALARLPGTGLGLTIVRNLVEKLGGAVRLDPAVGGGTAATLELPSS